MARPSKEYQAFRDLTRRLLKVPKAEVDRRIAAYKDEREKIPRWLLDELLSRLHHQINLPTPRIKTCRGRLYSKTDYAVDVVEWGFADLVGGENERKRAS